MNDDLLDGREVRLFPTAHIRSSREAELRATSSLLAMIRAVSEFGRAVIGAADGPRGRLECYTEVSFSEGEGMDSRNVRPDGLLRVVRGKTDWRALVEVKVGDNPLQQPQLDDYHQLAIREGLDALVTISNQAARPNGLPPATIDKRRLRRCPVTHLSWERLLSEARVLSRRQDVEDEDQRWMLDEWIRYVADPASRIIESPDLGDQWGVVLRAARAGHLGAVGRELRDVVEHWASYLQKTSLSLRAKLGADVDVRISRAEREDQELRLSNLFETAVSDGELGGRLRIQDAAGDVSIAVRLAARAVCFAVDVRAPTEGRCKTRVNWLIRQLKAADVPRDLMITIDWMRSRFVSQARLGDVLTSLGPLFRDGHGRSVPNDLVPRAFRLELATKLPRSRGRSSAPVLEGITNGLEDFYSNVVERLRAYVPPAPRIDSRPPPDHGSDDLAQPEAPPVAPPPSGPAMAPRDRFTDAIDAS